MPAGHCLGPPFPQFFFGEPVQFNGISEFVSISSPTGSTGSIRAMSPSSQVTSTDVQLSTPLLSGGGIGSAAIPLNVDVKRNFIFQPNGDFNVALNGAGPSRLNMMIGVAPPTQSYTGTAVRRRPDHVERHERHHGHRDNFSITGGFDDLAFNQGSLITLRVPTAY